MTLYVMLILLAQMNNVLYLPVDIAFPSEMNIIDKALKYLIISVETFIIMNIIMNKHKDTVYLPLVQIPDKDLLNTLLFHKQLEYR